MLILGEIEGGEDSLYGGKDRFSLHHHPASSAIGRVVGDVMFVSSIVADIVDGDGQATVLLGPFEDALFKRTGKHRGEKCEDIEVHIQRKAAEMV